MGFKIFLLIFFIAQTFGDCGIQNYVLDPEPWGGANCTKDLGNIYFYFSTLIVIRLWRHWRRNVQLRYWCWQLCLLSK